MWEIYGGLEKNACMFESWSAPEDDQVEEDEVLIPQSNPEHHNYSTF